MKKTSIVTLFFGALPASISCIQALLVGGLSFTFVLGALVSGSWLELLYHLFHLILASFATWGTISLWALVRDPTSVTKVIALGLLAGILAMIFTWLSFAQNVLVLGGTGFAFFVASPVAIAVWHLWRYAFPNYNLDNRYLKIIAPLIGTLIFLNILFKDPSELPTCVTQDTINEKYSDLFNRIIDYSESRGLPATESLPEIMTSLPNEMGKVPEIILEINLSGRRYIENIKEKLSADEYSRLLRQSSGNPQAAEFNARIDGRRKIHRWLRYQNAERIGGNFSYGNNASSDTWGTGINHGWMSKHRSKESKIIKDHFRVVQYSNYIRKGERLFALTLLFEYDGFIESLPACSKLADTKA